MFRPNSLLVALLLASLGALVWWLNQLQPDDGQLELTHRREPDYVADRIRAVVMDEQGRPDRLLLAEQLRHYPNDDSSELDHPYMELYSDDGTPPWEVQSRRGHISADADEVRLIDAVTVDRAAAPGLKPFALRTSELLVRPDEHYAETDRFVYIVSNQDWVTANAMRAWFPDTGSRVKLLERVKGLFESREATAQTPPGPVASPSTSQSGNQH